MEVIEQVATVETDRQVPFRCARCSFSGVATLSVTVEAAAAVISSHERASASAARRAVAGATRASARASLIIRCPKCGSYDAEKLKRYRRGRAAVAAGIFAFGLILCALGLVSGDLGMRRLLLGTGIVFGLCALQPIRQALRPPPVEVTWG